MPFEASIHRLYGGGADSCNDFDLAGQGAPSDGAVHASLGALRRLAETKRSSSGDYEFGT